MITKQEIVDVQQVIETSLEDLSMEIFGRSFSLALAGNACVKCGKPATEFTNELSRAEYKITAMCETCQNEYYNKLKENYE